MIRVAVHGENDVRLDEVPMPAPGPGDIVVRVRACGICGTDLGYARAGGMPMGGTHPLPLGHEFAGEVAEVGAGVTGLAPGQRVVINPTTPANYHGSGGPGAFASHILVRDALAADTVHPMPDGLDFETAALTEPLSVALHAVNRAGPAADAKVVLFGAGPIGLGIVAMLRRRGVADILVVDRVPERLERALKLGADAVANPDDGDIWAAIGGRHGRSLLYGMDVVDTDNFIDAAGAPGLVEQIVAKARFAAGLTVVAVHHRLAQVDLAMLLGKEMSITTAMAYPQEFAEVLDVLAENSLDLSAYVSHRFPFGRFEEAFATAADPSRAAKVMVTFP